MLNTCLSHDRQHLFVCFFVGNYCTRRRGSRLRWSLHNGLYKKTWFRSSLNTTQQTLEEDTVNALFKGYYLNQFNTCVVLYYNSFRFVRGACTIISQICKESICTIFYLYNFYYNCDPCPTLISTTCWFKIALSMMI